MEGKKPAAKTAKVTMQPGAPADNSSDPTPGPTETKPKEDSETKLKEDVYQFKITIRGSKPPIWRRIQVLGSTTFFGLHIAIQDAMHGWMDYHLHRFEFHRGPEFQLTSNAGADALDAFDREPPLSEEAELISTHFNLVARGRNSCIYEYDFGDSWEHEIKLEKIVPRDPEKVYPLLLGGRRACPPEDSGSIYGYMEKLEVLKKPKSREYREIYDWIMDQTEIQRSGRTRFDPAEFVVADLQFRDPEIELRRARR